MCNLILILRPPNIGHLEFDTEYKYNPLNFVHLNCKEKKHANDESDKNELVSGKGKYSLKFSLCTALIHLVSRFSYKWFNWMFRQIKI